MGYLDKNGLHNLITAGVHHHTFVSGQIPQPASAPMDACEAAYVAHLHALEREGERMQREAQEKLMTFQEGRRVQAAIACPTFAEFLATLDPHFPGLAAIQKLSWAEYAQTLRAFIAFELTAFEAVQEYPIAGIFFCVGQDGESLRISGARTFGVDDWAANPAFHNQQNASAILRHMAAHLPELWEADEAVLYKGMAEAKEILACRRASILYYFILHTLYHELTTTTAARAIENAAIAIGYPAGDELILGRFQKGRFLTEIHAIYEGDYTTCALEEGKSFKNWGI